MAQVRWSVTGLDDFEAIQDYLGRLSPVFASRFADRVETATQQLGLFPKSGRLVREPVGTPFREVSIAPYRLFYKIGTDDEVEIARVLYGKRNITRLLREGWS